MLLQALQTHDADQILAQFLNYIEQSGLQLYPAQEEAILQIFGAEHVILSTPTGSGKSLVATAMHYKGLCEGRRSVYTCPIKALVSEKFFALCNLFGAEHVGMLTGDASINRDAPIICCTAEVLSQIALSEGDRAKIDYVIIDEFHYFSDKERGVHWQIPLLTLPHTTFLLMSATMGDTAAIDKCILETTGRAPVLVSSTERPVPLDYRYSEVPLHECLYDLVCSHKYPVYVVNFTQRECAEEAQNAMSVNFCTKEEKRAILEEIAGFRFDSPYGKEMKRYVSHGIGLHHAGLLPKYRLLVEKLAQKGMMKVIMGTDTLGVGVNVPIRTVLFSKLCKFDGEKTGILSVRDFKQIAGRAGRKGFDEEGSVVCQAPDHVIENKRAEGKIASGGKKKVVKKAAPTKNYVHWNAATFQRLIEQPPEPLRSQFTLSHSMLLSALQADLSQASFGYRRLIKIIQRSLETQASKRKLRKRASQLFKSLKEAEIISLVKNRLTGTRVVINSALQEDFSLHHALSLFIMEALPKLDVNDPLYAHDVLSIVESVLEHPKVILMKQIDRLKTERLAELKAEGMEYEQRMEELEKIEHPKPLRDFIYGHFNNFRVKHPWIEEDNILPKSIAREMLEEGASFNQYISQYGLERSEGIVLRYISGAYKALVQSVPETLKIESCYDSEAFFREMLARVDSSLIAEWESMRLPKDLATPVQDKRLSFDPSVNIKAFRARVRAYLHAFVKALAMQDYTEALCHIRPDAAWNEASLVHSLAPFIAEHGRVIVDARARMSDLTVFDQKGPKLFHVRHVLVDDAGHNEWFIEAEVDFESITNPDEPLLSLKAIGI